MQDLAKLLSERGISGVPVVDNDRLVGIVSEGDLLHRFETGTERRTPRRRWRWFDRPPDEARDYVKSHGRTVREVMIREVISVGEEAGLSEVATLMETKRIKRVPVLRDGQLVGIISRANLVRALAAIDREPGTGVAADDRDTRAKLLTELNGREWARVWPEEIVVQDGVVQLWVSNTRSAAEREALRVAAENVSGVRRVAAASGDVRHRSHPAPGLALAFCRRHGLLPRSGSREARHPFVGAAVAGSDRGRNWHIRGNVLEDDGRYRRRNRLLPSRHGHHDGRPQGPCRLCPSRRAGESGGDIGERHVLGRGRHASRAVGQCHHHDHYWSGQRRVAELPAALELGVRRERRHDRDGMAGGPAGRQDLPHRLCTADRLRRCVAQADGKGQMGGEWCRNCGFRADPGGPDDAATGRERAGRAAAKRLAVAYVAFKVIAAVVALVLFPVVVRLMLRASESVDPVTLVAIYHTAHNVMGVAILLPLIGPFTRVIERIVPEPVSTFAGSLDPSALEAVPTVAVEAVRRTVARVLDALCTSANALADSSMVCEASVALNQARSFLSKVTEPWESEQETQWFISIVHALDHTIPLAEATQESAKIDGPDERRAQKLYRDAMRTVAEFAGPMARVSAPPSDPAASGTRSGDASEAVNRLASYSNELASLSVKHRRTILDALAAGGLTASDAIAHVDAVRLLDQRVHHAWRATAHLAPAVA